MEKKLIEEFPYKVWGLQRLNKILKKKLRKAGKTKQQRSTKNCANGREHWRCHVFLFCNIHTQTGYYKKEWVIWLQIFSAAILPNIVNICQQNKKQKLKQKGWHLWDTVYIADKQQSSLSSETRSFGLCFFFW